jgi:nucleotide-binding universal stress UspA family protein
MLPVDQEMPMIKDVMVPLDGSSADEIRLAAVADIAEHFDIRATGLFINVLPILAPAEWDGIGARQAWEVLQELRQNSETIAGEIERRLSTLQFSVALRRIDAVEGTQGDAAAREARSADVFVALRPNGTPGQREVVTESVLFETGRHLYLAPAGESSPGAFDRIALAWNGSREATRATAEAMPYLLKAEMVDVIVVQDGSLVSHINGSDMVTHLLHHGVGATLHDVKPRAGGIGATLIAEAQERSADLIVMGGYGHSRLREWLLGGVTYDLMHRAPVPLVIAH